MNDRRYRLRANEAGQLVLQVQQFLHTRTGYVPPPDSCDTWRDARVEDVCQFQSQSLTLPVPLFVG